MWNLQSDRPIYLQLIEVIKMRIISGQYKPGERLSSVRELAEEASVNPNTMQKALSELERSGLIYTQRTNGRFITEDNAMVQTIRMQLAKDEIQKFLEVMKGYGFHSNDVITLIEAISHQ